MKKFTLIFALLLSTVISQAQVSPTSLKSMIGKHYSIVSLLVEDMELPVEGDLCIKSYAALLVLGDGDGYADELHIYSIADASNNVKWKISCDSGEGFIQLNPEFTKNNPDKILIIINDGSSKTFVLKNKPFDKPTLKQK